MKKAVSPLLAGVLLVAVTVGIATLTTGFMSTTFQSTQVAITNKTADAATCANAEIVIDGAFVKAGDNGTVTVPVRNSGFSDLQLSSAQLYDKLGNNFSASNMPLSISRGQMLNLNFQLAKFANMTADSSGLNNIGNCTNMGIGNANDTCSYTLDGKSGSAMRFSRTGQYIKAGNASNLDLTSTVTVEAWIKTNSWAGPSGGRQNIVTKASSNGQYFIYIDNYYNNESGRIDAGIWNNSIEIGQHALNVISLNQWQHVAFTYDGSDMKIYKDGLQVANRTTTTPIDSNTGKLYIGSNFWTGLPSDSNFFNGTLDEVAVWNRSLSGEEINSTMLSGVTSINTTGLVGYWKFDEGRGVLVCSDFSQVVVTTNCGGISATFDRMPKCS